MFKPINIAATSYTLSQKSLDIYVAGCNPPHCENCHNPELWEFIVGERYSYDYFYTHIKEKILTFEPLVERIFIMGGEPLDQSQSLLEEFLLDMISTGKEVWLFTKYEIEEVHPRIRYLCDYIKTGRYDSSLQSDNYISHDIKLASTNQKVWSRDDIRKGR